MPRPTARGRDQGNQSRKAKSPVVAHKIDAHQVGAQIGHEEKFTRRVHDGVVRARTVLAIVYGAGPGEVVGFGFDEGQGVEVRGGGQVEGCHAGAFAVCAWVSEPFSL